MRTGHTGLFNAYHIHREHHPIELLDPGDDLTVKAGLLPRYPAPIPWDGVVTDTGEFLNMSADATPYTHGLEGVDQNANYLYVNILVASFFGAMAITFLYRWFLMYSSHVRHLVTMGGGRQDQRYWMYNHSPFWARMKRSLIYAPLFRNRHNKEIQLSSAVSIGTLPSRYHSLILFLYLASNVAYTLVLNYDADRYAIIAEVRGRTGILSVLNLIPTVLFALRNNPLIPLLGCSYDTFNLLHRWCARIVIVEALAHTGAWAYNAYHSGGQAQVALSLSSSVSYTWGMVGTCAFGFILLASLSPIRHAFYETFLNFHRLMVMLGIIGVYIHLDRASLPQVPYVQLCLALWVAEWAWRSVRICYHNFSRKHGVTRVTVEALPAEACRVTFDLAKPWHWTPGCHVHAYLPAFALWSSHPFSIAWAENRSRDGMTELSEKLTSRRHSEFRPRGTYMNGEDARRAPLTTRQSSFSKGSAALSPIKSQTPNLVLRPDSACTTVSLVMRARTGLTRKLYDKAAAAPSGMITTWGAIEGPYGGHESMTSYGTVVLFAGGVGITHCVGYVHHLMMQYQAGTTSTQKILLVWSVPNTEALEWVRVWMDKILRMEGRRDVLRIQLFVTKPRHRGEVISNTGSVQMFPGRCNPQTVLQKEMQERIGAMGVTVCGPGAFSDSVRKAVRDVVEDGSVDFVEEAFTY